VTGQPLARSLAFNESWFLKNALASCCVLLRGALWTERERSFWKMTQYNAALQGNCIGPHVEIPFRGFCFMATARVKELNYCFCISKIVI